MKLLLAAAALAAACGALTVSAHGHGHAHPHHPHALRAKHHGQRKQRSGSHNPVQKLLAKAVSEKVHAHKQGLLQGTLGVAPTVNTTYGPVMGITNPNGTVYQYLNIPFGNSGPAYRWRAPGAPQAWETPRNSSWWGPACIQSAGIWTDFVGMAEDCLNLNVYVPATPAAQGPMPVMLFIHGGSWVYGTGGFILYDGIYDVELMQNIVLVTINYRLGPFGYLAGDLLQQESPDGSVGNYGLDDQRAAMRWVRANIANFGGNPNNVMLFGESAGGGSTSDHLVSPLSWGPGTGLPAGQLLFHRAGIESGAFSDWSAQPLSIAGQRLPELLANAGCNTSSDPLGCLRALPADNITSFTNNGMTQAFLEWGPVIDGVNLLDTPVNLLTTPGAVAPVPILLGFNRDEGTLFNSAPHDMNNTEADVANALIPVTGPELAPIIAAQYNIADYSGPSASNAWWTVSAALGDSQMICPGKRAAAMLSDPTLRNGTFPVYAYYFTHLYAIISFVDLYKPLGCFHGSELVSVYNLYPVLIGAGEPALAQQMVRYWTRFAASGNPNGGNDPAWAPYTSAAADLIAQLDVGSDAQANVTMIRGLKDDICSFWFNTTIPASAIWGN